MRGSIATLVTMGIFCVSLAGCLPTPKVSGEPSTSGQWSDRMLLVRIAHPGPHLKNEFFTGSSGIVPRSAYHLRHDLPEHVGYVTYESGSRDLVKMMDQ
jgi:hypothetical protein